MLKLSAWLGFLASVTVHLCTLNGFVPLGKAAFILHAGMFVVLFPALLIYGPTLKLQGWWRTFRAFPILSQLLVVALFANCIVAMVTMRHLPKNPVGADFVQMLRGFSSIWCYLYFLVASLVSKPPGRLAGGL